MKFTVNDGGLKVALTKNMNAKGLKLGLAAAALELKGMFQIVPAVSRRPQAPYWKDKQRRGFFARLNKGEIEVPYVRGANKMSQKLSQSWTTEARDNGLTQIIGTAVSYAPLVQSAAKQAQYHKISGWRTESQILADGQAKAVKTIEFYITKTL
jgi:hypothetical protein